MQVEVNKLANGTYGIEVTERFLRTLEEAANLLTNGYHVDLAKHKGCDMGEVGCKLTPGGPCDEDLMYLYAQLADVHNFLHQARWARHSSAPRREAPHEGSVVGSPSGPIHIIDDAGFAMDTKNAALTKLDNDKTVIMPKITA